MIDEVVKLRMEHSDMVIRLQKFHWVYEDLLRGYQSLALKSERMEALLRGTLQGFTPKMGEIEEVLNGGAVEEGVFEPRR